MATVVPVLIVAIIWVPALIGLAIMANDVCNGLRKIKTQERK